MTDVKNTATQIGGRGPSILTLLVILFIALKLTGEINWSWLWVLAPLWIPWAVLLFLLVLLGIAQIVVWRYEKRLKKIRRNQMTRR